MGVDTENLPRREGLIEALSAVAFSVNAVLDALEAVFFSATTADVLISRALSRLA